MGTVWDSDPPPSNATAVSTSTFFSQYPNECFTHRSSWWDQLLGRPRFAIRIVQQDRLWFRVELLFEDGPDAHVLAQTCHGPDSVGELMVAFGPWVPRRLARRAVRAAWNAKVAVHSTALPLLLDESKALTARLSQNGFVTAPVYSSQETPSGFPGCHALGSAQVHGTSRFSQ